MEMELYHIHKKGIKDHKWKENSTIVVDNKFNSIMNERRNSFNQLVKLRDGNEDVLMNYYQYLTLISNDINSYTKEDLKNILMSGYHIFYNANLFRRETAMEDFRRDNCSDLPSRLHSIYLCDSDGLEYWNDIISKENKEEVEIFKVYANGKIFKGNEQLIPNELLDYKGTYDASYKYWNPKFNGLPNYTNEYLIEGKIKVLEKIK